MFSYLNGRLIQVTAALVACIGAFSWGTVLAWTGAALPYIAGCLNDCDYSYTAEQGSWIGSLAPLGCLAGCFANGFLMDIFGRKWTITGMAVPLIIGWFMMLTPNLVGIHPDITIYIFYVGRFVQGFSCGAYILVSSIYISECSEQNIRGTLGNMMSLMMNLGLLYTNGVEILLHWTVMTGTCLIFPILILVAMPFMPESPVFLMSKQREEDARKTLKRLRSPQYDINKEINQIKKSLAEKQAVGSASVKDMVTRREYFLPMIVGIMLFLIQAMSGLDAITFYLGDIYIHAGTGIDPALQATLASLCMVVGVLLSMFLVERLGRKALLIISISGSAFSILALGTFFYIDENKCLKNMPNEECNSGFDQELIDNLKWMPVASTMLYFLFLLMGIVPLPYMMNGELFPEECKSAASSLSTATMWLMSFVVSKINVNLQTVLGYSGTYFLYGAFCTLGIVYILLGVPETKGKTPEEILQYFRIGQKQRNESSESKGTDFKDNNVFGLSYKQYPMAYRG